MRCQWVWSDFGQPVYWSSGLRSCVAGEFAWYVLLWNLLTFGWCWISSLWSARECPVMSYEMSMGLELLWAACILKLRAVFLCCWRICMVCLALELVGSWVVLGFSVGVGGFWMCSYRLMFPGVRSSLVFSRFELKPPVSGFQSYFYSSLKTSASIQHWW